MLVIDCRDGIDQAARDGTDLRRITVNKPSTLSSPATPRLRVEGSGTGCGGGLNALVVLRGFGPPAWKSA